MAGEARRSVRDAERVALFRQALDLWCGPALADAAAPEVVNRLTSGLAESRLTATEECIEAELRLGRSLAVLDELVDLVARHPYRERLVALLMTAQYRADRPADALATLRTARTLLAHDLGLAPGERLARLEEAILRSDPALDLRVADDVRIARAQLPADLTGFAGRADQLSGQSKTNSNRPNIFLPPCTRTLSGIVLLPTPLRTLSPETHVWCICCWLVSLISARTLLLAPSAWPPTPIFQRYRSG